MIHPTIKKFICSLALVFFIFLMGVSLALALPGDGTGGKADGAPPPEPSSTKSSSDSGGSTSGSGTDKPVVPNDLFQQFKYGTGDAKSMNGTKIGAVAALPNETWQVTLGYVVRTLLNICSGLTLLALTVGGTMMVVAGGKQELLDKGKKIVVQSIIGLIIIAVSYALVIGVSEFQFFTPGTAGGPSSGAASGSTTNPPANNGGGKSATAPGE